MGFGSLGPNRNGWDMGFYDLSKEERAERVIEIDQAIASDLVNGKFDFMQACFSDEDTYIRKLGYQGIGKIYKADTKIGAVLMELLQELFKSPNAKIRQTTLNAAGEIGMVDFGWVRPLFDKGLFDEHHSVRNAVIGSLKKMANKNPWPIIKWAEPFLDHPDKEVRRQICHGLELRGRTHPQDILPLLKKLEWDDTARVKNTLIHVIGQIAYKKGCLETVVFALRGWSNAELIEKCLDEIVDVHKRYKNFAALSQEEAIAYIDTNLSDWKG